MLEKCGEQGMMDVGQGLIDDHIGVRDLGTALYRALIHKLAKNSDVIRNQLHIEHPLYGFKPLMPYILSQIVELPTEELDDTREIFPSPLGCTQARVYGGQPPSCLNHR